MSVSRKVSVLLETACVLQRLRTIRPRVHCITGALTQSATSGILRALGPVPSMSTSASDASAFVEVVDALFVDLDVLDESGIDALDDVVKAANQIRVPWVLDPSMTDRSPAQRDAALRLLERRPSVVRVNVTELLALLPEKQSIAGFARDRDITVALSGVVDTVSDGRRQFMLENGHEMMGLTTGLGAAMTAVIAAACVVERAPLVAAATGLSLVNIAGEIAAGQAHGPKSFSIAILDALHAVSERDVKRRIKANEECLKAVDLAVPGRETTRELTAT
ncbi:hydroxyethylthiazole kinase [Breoghania sp.]|uniref:hydroxyethylthiazole kinase n=1 Tax=Breoghania sp. TaxID=2065378 RepID=UPI0026244DF2|nr:hydroxyethylthiazole kinase [Breoghania sp.]MDJ0931219.1 hydroxyethylthiazole kinase [Breoghania sp.]